MHLLEIHCMAMLFLCFVLKVDSLHGCITSDMSLRCGDSSAKSFRSQTNVSAEKFSPWLHLAEVAMFAFQQMSSFEGRLGKRRKSDHLMVVLFEPTATQAASYFMNKLSAVHNNVVYISLTLEDNHNTSGSFDKIIDVFLRNRNEVSTVAIFTGDVKSVVRLLTSVNDTTGLKITGILHTTEWMIASPNSYKLSTLQNVLENVDFITILFRCISQMIYVAQKSRNEALIMKAKVTGFDSTMSVYHCTYKASIKRKLVKRRTLRKHAMEFLGEQKSVLAGFHVRAAVLDTDVPDLSARTEDGHLSTMDGYSPALLRIMSASLDFTYHYVAIEDQGHYGVAGTNGSSNGLVGLLDRRQAEITTLPLSRTSQRLQVIDFVPVVIYWDTVYLIYRSLEPDNDIDLIYVSIVKADFFFYLLGPALMLAVIGAAVHVATRACTSAQPECCSRDGAGYVMSFTENICFHTSRTYPGHTARVLRTTWALFWLIICSAYSAFLVTTFTIKPTETPMNTFKRLAEAKDFSIGTYNTATALLNVLRTSTNSSLQDLRKRLVELNDTNNNTLHPSVNYHATRVVKERYAFLSGFCGSTSYCDDIFEDKIHQIRAYAMKIDELPEECYTAIPKNAFYGEDVYINLLHLQEAGLIRHLQWLYFKPGLLKQLQSQKLHETEKAVNISRITLPLYAVLTGICLSVLALCLEMLYHRLTLWRKNMFNEAKG